MFVAGERPLPDRADDDHHPTRPRAVLTLRRGVERVRQDPKTLYQSGELQGEPVPYTKSHHTLPSESNELGQCMAMQSESFVKITKMHTV